MKTGHSLLLPGLQPNKSLGLVHQLISQKNQIKMQILHQGNKETKKIK
jgi:hypothetical protein